MQIARCLDAADVMAAVKYGRENNLLTAIRGGGHNGAGPGTCDGGPVIDLWHEVDAETQKFGMAKPSDRVHTPIGTTLSGYWR